MWPFLFILYRPLHLSFSCIHHLFSGPPMKMMNRGFTVYNFIVFCRGLPLNKGCFLLWERSLSHWLMISSMTSKTLQSTVHYRFQLYTEFTRFRYLHYPLFSMILDTSPFLHIIKSSLQIYHEVHSPAAKFLQQVLPQLDLCLHVINALHRWWVIWPDLSMQHLL
jgi:hypothetical protein